MSKVYEIDVKDYSGINGFRENYENDEIYKDNLIVYGGRDFNSYIKDELNKFIDSDNDVFSLDELYRYVGGNTDEIVLKCLENKTKQRGYVGYFNGYSQSDGVKVFYTDKVSNDNLRYLGNLYFGCYKEFRVYDFDDDNDYYLDMVVDKEYYDNGMSYTKIFRDRLNDNNVVVNIIDSYESVVKYRDERL